MLGGAEVPATPDAEQAILGAMLLDSEAIDTAVQELRPDFFYDQANALLFEIISDLYSRELAADLTSVIAELKRRRALDKVGGPSYVAALPNQVFSVANIDHYIHQVRAAYELRQLLRISDEIRGQVIENSRDVGEIVEFAERRIFDLALERKNKDFYPTQTLVPEVLEELEKRRTEDYHRRGVITGFLDLDSMTGGLQPSDLIILAARPSVGKTALAMNIALNVGVGRPKGKRIDPAVRRPVGIFSLEMSAQQITQRFLATLAEVPMTKLRKGRVSEREEKKVEKMAEELAQAPIYIDDTPHLTVVELRSKARRLKSRITDLSLIVVDYLQLMHSGGRVENRQQEVAEITRSLKALARELDVPVLALSQLGRQVEQRKGRKSRPMLSDLRESGAIEQDADLVLFIHRNIDADRMRRDEEDSAPPIVESELIIGKHRNGPIGIVNLFFIPEIASFVSMDASGRHDDDNVGY
jgi:replicative DNA helicase